MILLQKSKCVLSLLLLLFFAMSRSYIRNLENAVNFDCNSQAFNQTNNIDICDCLRYSNINFTEYINIKKKCIIAKQS